jgi:thiosulfate/3-mercaptopyruvate sulfurtransferase
MPATTSPLISPKNISTGNDVIIIDARSGPDAFERYRSSHLEKALHADLDHDLSQKPKDPAYGGRHPLPDAKLFAAMVGRLGITPATHVVVYDDKSGANAAARFWWMMRALGHAKIHVVDGGLDAIVREGLPMSSDVHEPQAAKPYPADQWQLPIADIEDVEVAVKDPDALVIDVREAYRYRGEREPIDLTAGHIPGAINIPYLNNLNDDGTFRSAEELSSLYKQALDNRNPKNVIVHCGSGVTACHTLLALDQAGIQGANLYVGSWSEWSRRDLPVGTGNE